MHIKAIYEDNIRKCFSDSSPQTDHALDVRSAKKRKLNTDIADHEKIRIIERCFELIDEYKGKALSTRQMR